MSQKSNKELAEDIRVLAATLGVEADTEGFKNAELVSMLEGLKAREAALAPPTEPDAGAVTPPADEPPPAPPLVDGAESGTVGGTPVPSVAPPAIEQKFEYQVAPGKSITSLRGILDQGAEVRPTDFVGGQTDLDALVPKYVTKRS